MLIYGMNLSIHICPRATAYRYHRRICVGYGTGMVLEAPRCIYQMRRGRITVTAFSVPICGHGTGDDLYPHDTDTIAQGECLFRHSCKCSREYIGCVCVLVSAPIRAREFLGVHALLRIMDVRVMIADP